eukprot:scaffold90317_cov34-Attheya_sp.AAC.1
MAPSTPMTTPHVTPIRSLDWRTTTLVSGRPLLRRHVQRRHVRAFRIVDMLLLPRHVGGGCGKCRQVGWVDL